VRVLSNPFEILLHGLLRVSCRDLGSYDRDVRYTPMNRPRRHAGSRPECANKRLMRCSISAELCETIDALTTLNKHFGRETRSIALKPC